MNLENIDKIYDKSFYSKKTKQQSILIQYLIPYFVARNLKIESVCELGIGTGKLLKEFTDFFKIKDYIGYDLSIIPLEFLCLDNKHFIACDLSLPFENKKHYDLAISLEVAEHLPEESAETFLDNLTGVNNKYIMFSSAIKGQGGYNHINEQPHEYWVEKFERRGYKYSLDIRDNIKEKADVPFWYKQNIIFFEKDN